MEFDRFVVTEKGIQSIKSMSPKKETNNTPDGETPEEVKDEEEHHEDEVIACDGEV